MDEKRTMVTKDDVRAALTSVIDPDEGKDIVTLGRVQGLVVRGGNVGFTIEVEAERGPALEPLRKKAEETVMALDGVVSVTAVLTAEKSADAAPAQKPVEPPAQPQQAQGKIGGHGHAPDPDAPPLLADVKHVIAVASGKGGVGKSTVAVNLAVALADQGHSVGLLDADIYGPSLPMMMGINDRPQSKDGKIIEPLENYGVKTMSIGYLIKEGTAMVWRGPMVMGALQQMMRDVNWGKLDVLVVDMPPGTGDAQLTMAQNTSMSGAVIVSTPQDIALLDARKGITMFEKVDVPVLGIIENMSSFACPECGHESHIFGHGGAKACAEELGATFLGEIPLDIEIRKTSEAGQPITATSPDGVHAKRFKDIAKQVWETVEK